MIWEFAGWTTGAMGGVNAAREKPNEAFLTDSGVRPLMSSELPPSMSWDVRRRRAEVLVSRMFGLTPAKGR
jgi:hypothetical protein